MTNRQTRHNSGEIISKDQEIELLLLPERERDGYDDKVSSPLLKERDYDPAVTM